MFVIFNFLLQYISSFLQVIIIKIAYMYKDNTVFFFDKRSRWAGFIYQVGRA